MIHATIDKKGIHIFNGDKELVANQDFVIAATTDWRTAYVRFGLRCYFGWQANPRIPYASGPAMTRQTAMRRLADCVNKQRPRASQHKLMTYRGP